MSKSKKIGYFFKTAILFYLLSLISSVVFSYIVFNSEVFTFLSNLLLKFISNTNAISLAIYAILYFIATYSVANAFVKSHFAYEDKLKIVNLFFKINFAFNLFFTIIDVVSIIKFEGDWKSLITNIVLAIVSVISCIKIAKY